MSNRRNIRLIFRQYAKPNSNQLSRINSTQGDAYSGIFGLSAKQVMVLADRMLNEYRERAFFIFRSGITFFQTYDRMAL